MSARILRLTVCRCGDSLRDDDHDEDRELLIGIDLETGMVFRPGAGSWAAAPVAEADLVEPADGRAEYHNAYHVRVEVLP